MQLLKALWALAGAAICCFLIFVIHSQFLKEGQLAAGTCEIVTLDRDSSQPRRTIARQTARCACKKGQIAGTTRARPACVDARIIKTKQWCEMLPCLEGEGCDLLINKSGWTCTQPGGRIKTTTVKNFYSWDCQQTDSKGGLAKFVQACIPTAGYWTSLERTEKLGYLIQHNETPLERRT
ncbi:chemokine-like protein TAFA-5 isoform X1 [Trachemys scripta elegans]|uniref:chemokine-like protein TAFA-5 isoform X1 n=1 Tax=Trachemys scripta elegans TaxID=31138 RepID=UPI0015575587|nr:chemokine-like protein TAFA-5 isoform X1 [Trachemys scripta elegans]